MRCWMCSLRKVGFLVLAAASVIAPARSALAQATCALPGAATVYTTGFESPTFTLGPIAGQDGWGANGDIQNATVLTGSQALRLVNTTLGGPAFAAVRFVNVPVSTQTQAFSYSADFLYASGSGQAAIDVFSDTGFVAQVASVNGTYYFGNVHSFAPPAAIADGVWHHLEIVINFQTQMITGSVDGVSLGTLPIDTVPVPTRINLIDVRTQNLVAPATVYLDNVSACVTQVACCDTTTGACSLASACPPGAVAASPAATSCSPQPCPQPTACCDTTSGACTLALPGAACGAGTVAAAGSPSACGPTTCPLPHACCNTTTGACVIALPGQSCPAGTFSGMVVVTTCAVAFCPQPLACCDNTTGACSVVPPGTTGAVCAAGTTAAAGNPSSCSPDPCPKGACCDTIGGCSISSPTGCATFYRGDGSTCGAGTCVGACCLISGMCGTQSPAGCVGSFQGLGTSCTPANPCPQPVCCNGITGQCAFAVNGACPAGSLLVGNVFTCSPSPCLANVGLTCSDCTYVNGPYDGRDGQLSHLGGASPHGTKAADDFYLCDNFVYDLKTFSATILTTTFQGLVKPVGEIWSDCNGCPGDLLYTFTNPLIVETGA
ncbi:MAG TPA: hypothetical protein VHC70_10185, partial [Phycisphaerales bacterium]|nr:hypothetical protein [Phycisphaerales bacterium]